MAAVLCGLVIGMGSARAAQDCAAAQQLYGQASRESRLDPDAAVDHLRQAIAACPTHAAWQLLGELQARSAARTEKQQAVDSFLAAHELAGDNAQRAASLGAYAGLLAREGDSQNAYPLAREAQQLAPQDAAIRALVAELEPQVRDPSREQLVRGLGSSLFRPLRVNAGGAVNATNPANAAGRPAGSAPPAGPSINIPVNFERDSTTVDAQSRPNLGKLAAALDDPAFAGRRFVFVGHADARGDAAYNLELSRRRAEAIHQELLLQVPSLQGRVRVEGRGASEPLDTGSTEAAHRANRRLQVYLE